MDEEENEEESDDGKKESPEEVEVREMKHRLEKFGCF